MPSDAEIMEAVQAIEWPPMDFSTLPVALDSAARLLAQDGLVNWDEDDEVAD